MPKRIRGLVKGEASFSTAGHTRASDGLRSASTALTQRPQIGVEAMEASWRRWQGHWALPATQPSQVQEHMGTAGSSVERAESSLSVRLCGQRCGTEGPRERSGRGKWDRGPSVVSRTH